MTKYKYYKYYITNILSHYNQINLLFVEKEALQQLNANDCLINNISL